MSAEHVKKAVRLGWDEMSERYQLDTVISLDDVHYAPLCPGERELSVIGDVRGKRSLELACGAAQNSIALSKWGADATAIDVSIGQLQQAKALIRMEGVAVELLQGDVENLELFKSGSFDMAISCFGLEFLPDPSACLSGCYRLLREGGLLVLGTVHPLTAFEWDEDGGFLCVNDYFSPPLEVWDEPTEGDGPKGMTFFRSFEEVFGMLVDAGFRVEQVIEPAPYDAEDPRRGSAPYGGAYWESQRERLSKVPFAIVYKARKPKSH